MESGSYQDKNRKNAKAGIVLVEVYPSQNDEIPLLPC